jgi:hypothetical protein
MAAWNDVAAAFGGHDAPGTLLGVAVLEHPGQLVEIDVIATAFRQHPAASNQTAASQMTAVRPAGAPIDGPGANDRKDESGPEPPAEVPDAWALHGRR